MRTSTTPASWLTAFSKGRDLTRSVPFKVAGLGFALASLGTLVIPRTQLGEGIGPNPLWPVALLLVLLFAAPFPEDEPGPTRVLWPLAFALLGFPFVAPSAQIGLGLVALAGVAGAIPGGASRAWARSLLRTSALWLGVVLVYGAYVYLVPRAGVVSVPGSVASWLFSLTGQASAPGGAYATLGYDSHAYRALLSPDKFGGAFPWLFLASVVPPAFRFYGARGVGIAVATTAVYALGRALWIVQGGVTAVAAEPWWYDERIVTSFLPLSVALGLLLRHVPAAKPRPAEPAAPTRWGTWSVPAAAVGACLVVFGWSWEDPGRPKDGKVMIDESHSRWEWSYPPLSPTLYGVRTVYSYSCMAAELAARYRVVQNFAPITDESLRDVSVLILKTPTSAYPQETVGAIDRFLRRGGGVWLVGDHTNIFGMDAYLNEIGARYGLTFEANAVVDPDTNRQITRPSYGSHPVIQHMPTFLFYTSCAVRPSWTSRDVLVSDHLLVDEADYSQNTFFGDFKPSLDEAIEPVVQAAATSVGQGRLALWSDSTLFSNFAIFLPGKMELANGYVQWLSRRNGPAWPRWTIVAAGVAAVALGRRRLWACWFGAPVALLAVAALNAHAYPATPIPDVAPRVAFLESDVDGHLPVTNPPPDTPGPNSYLNAFVLCQRIGLRPLVAPTLDVALKERIVVMCHGHRRLSSEQSRRLGDWVRAGGRLLVLDGGIGDPADSKTLIEGSGLSIAEVDRPASAMSLLPELAKNREVAYRADVSDGGKERYGTQMLYTKLLGGKPFLRDEKGGQSFGSEIEVGSGSVAFTTTTTLFSDLSLGDPSTIPNARQKALHRFFYDLMRSWTSPAKRDQAIPTE